MGEPRVALIACAILRARAWLSWSALAACPFLTAPPVFFPGAAALLLCGDVAGTAPALFGTVDAVGACPADTVAAVCVGGRAGNGAAADGGGTATK
eukprot:1160517-Pelagomonas_calceolata.AAC.8